MRHMGALSDSRNSRAMAAFHPLRTLALRRITVRMSEPRLQLFKVECRGRSGAVSHFFVPARSADAAIVQAIDCVQAARAEEPDIADPFEEAGLEVRVGTFENPASPTIIFGEWSRLQN